MLKAVFFFEVHLDLGESYLYGTADGEGTRYMINLQGGKPAIVLPSNLAGNFFHLDKAKLCVRTHKENIAFDLPISLGNDMIEIYDDVLLGRLAAERDLVFEISI